MHPQSETTVVVFKSGSVVQLVRIHACHAWGVARFGSRRTAEMPVSRSINRHFTLLLYFIFSIYSFGRLWMMIVYLPDMCFKKDGDKEFEYLPQKLFFLAVWTGLEPATPMRDEHVF